MSDHIHEPTNNRCSCGAWVYRGPLPFPLEITTGSASYELVIEFTVISSLHRRPHLRERLTQENPDE